MRALALIKRKVRLYLERTVLPLTRTIRKEQINEFIKNVIEFLNWMCNRVRVEKCIIQNLPIFKSDAIHNET